MKITLPDGTKTAQVARYAYKYCVALKVGEGPWFSSWALTKAAAKRTVEMWQKNCKTVEYRIIPL